MKTIHHITLTFLSLLFMTAPSAKAYLYSTSDQRFGPNSITVDTSTGLGWLNVGETTGLSYQQVYSQTQPGGMFSGFRFATVPEIVQLYNSAGLTPSAYGDIAHYYQASSPLIQTFFSLLGTSGTINGLLGIYALSGTAPHSPGFYYAPSVYGWDYAQEYWVSDGGGGAEFNATVSFPDLSSWLVTSVPEPAAANFIVLAGGVWWGFMFSHRRKRALQGS